MEANELRIGNYVSTPNQPIFRIDLFDYVAKGIGKFGQISSPDTHPLTWYLQDITPIPLTEDILLKCGFTKGDYHTNWFSHIELNCHLVQFSDGEYVLEGVDDIRLSEGFRYVHQLQNIYFALANEELKMNL